jgi:hypothetical protein
VSNFSIDVHPLDIGDSYNPETGGWYFIYTINGVIIESTEPERYPMSLEGYKGVYLWAAREKFNRFLAEQFKNWLIENNETLDS